MTAELQLPAEPGAGQESALSRRGRRNRANGHDAERRVARYLRTWWPDACRAVRNTTPDPGDIDATSPGLWWSVKDCQQERMATWLAELDTKAQGRLGLLVVRRRGHAWPAEWWAWLDAGYLVAIASRRDHTFESFGWPVRAELRHVVPLLVEAGYAPSAVVREVP